MASEELDSIKIRVFLKTLTLEEVVDSVHLVDLDFSVCPMNDIVEAVWTLFLEYQALKKKVLESPQTLDEEYADYNRKKFIIKKLFVCEELHELVLEKGMCTYLEKINVLKR